MIYGIEGVLLDIDGVLTVDWRPLPGAPEAVTDIVPEDVGLAPPQKRYEAVRAGFGKRMPWQPRRFTGAVRIHLR